VDSEYVIFVIDTSGSMRRLARAPDEMAQTLDAYPR
jgi:Mg-chelatase subunit ChlD